MSFCCGIALISYNIGENSALSLDCTLTQILGGADLTTIYSIKKL